MYGRPAHRSHEATEYFSQSSNGSAAAAGEPKRFHESLMGNMEEWLSTFSARNLADDGELAQLVERAREQCTRRQRTR